MRVSDLLMNKNYINSIASNKNKVDELSKKIANQSSILKPSDSPFGTAKILRLQNELSTNQLFLNNIQNSFGFVDETIRGMETIESEIANIRVILSDANNAVNAENLNTFADQLDQSLQNILTAANTSYDGKYVFGGTSFSSQPYSFTNDGLAIKQNVEDLSGVSKAKIGKGATQKININGAELFGTIIKQSGDFNSADAVGTITSDSTTVKDAYGNTYDLELDYEKTASNEYQLTYTVKDSGGNTVKTDNAALVFDANSGSIVSVDGQSKKSINIGSSANNLNFVLDFNALGESSTGSSLSLSANQDQDNFNTIIKMREDLKNGIQPSAADVESIENFHDRLLNKMSEAGYVYNNLENTKSLLESQQVEVQGMISAEKDLDMAKAIVDMQNYEYLLQASYKMSAMILPKSLLDFI